MPKIQGPFRRREFLTALSATAVASFSGALSGCARSNDNGQELIASAAGARQERYGLAWLAGSAKAQTVATSLTGFRGHEVILHPQRKHNLLFIARRPGTEIWEVDTRSQSVVARLNCAPGHHLNGHACFSDDGEYLYTVESNIAKGEGRIVVRDGDTYQVVEVLPSYGVGPHQAKIIPGSHILVVANGGILTHPLSGRKKLNLSSMRSSLTYLDLRNGQLIDEFTVPESKASIRHLDVAPDGTVAFATQLQREAVEHTEVVALGGYHKPGQALQLFMQPKQVIAQLDDYMGSVSINRASRIVGFTSPRGNLAVFWHIDSGDFQHYHRFHDVCGIACSGDDQQFVLSNSAGQLRRLDAFTLQEHRDLRAEYPATAWDNHLLIANTKA